MTPRAHVLSVRPFVLGVLSTLALASVLLAPCASAAPGASADPSPCSSLRDVRWLLGEWSTASTSDRGSVTSESWREVSPSTFEGVGATLDRSTGELKSRESLRLVEMLGEVFYLAKVGHNAVPIAFKLTECSQHHAVFENPEHDFPKKLAYQLDAEGQLTVTVSDGGERGFQLVFRRD